MHTYRCKNTTSTSTSSRSSWRKSFRKCDTDSYVMWPHTTMCLRMVIFQIRSKIVDFPAFYSGDIYFICFLSTQYGIVLKKIGKLGKRKTLY